MGHAGAIVSGGRGTAEAKVRRCAAAGVPVADRPDEIPGLLAARLLRTGRIATMSRDGSPLSAANLPWLEELHEAWERDARRSDEQLGRGLPGRGEHAACSQESIAGAAARRRWSPRTWSTSRAGSTA